MEGKYFRLPNGADVIVREVWNCCDGVNDCGSVLEIYSESEEFLTSLNDVTIPKKDDYDTLEEYRVAMGDFLAFIESECWDLLD